MPRKKEAEVLDDGVAEAEAKARAEVKAIVDGSSMSEAAKVGVCLSFGIPYEAPAD